MNLSKPVSTPITVDFATQSGINRQRDIKETHEMMNCQYRELIGSLLYLARRTLPDICQAVSILCRYTNNPSLEHWKAAKRVLRYLSGTKDYSITIGRTSTNSNTSEELLAYSDADWAGDKLDKKSTTGYEIYLNGAIVSWNSSKQKSTALSSTEAEYIALADCVRRVVYLRKIYEELGSTCGTSPATIYEDNQSCIAWVHSPGKRGKHVEV